MLDTRERLVEILEGAGKMIQFPGTLANILIENGVTIQAEPKTNADLIRARNDHELADMFSSFICDINEGVEYSDNPNRWLEWLQEPVEVDHES